MEYRNLEARCACSAEIDFVCLLSDRLEAEEICVARETDVALDDFIELESGSVFWSFADFVALIGRRDIQRVVNGNARPILTDNDEVFVWLPRNEKSLRLDSRHAEVIRLGARRPRCNQVRALFPGQTYLRIGVHR